MMSHLVAQTRLFVVIGLVAFPSAAYGINPVPPAESMVVPVIPEIPVSPTAIDRIPQPELPPNLPEPELPGNEGNSPPKPLYPPAPIPSPKRPPAIAPPPYVQEKPLWLEIKLSRRQVTVYKGGQPVKSYPIAVGRPGWETPTGTFQVRQMFRNPTWVHPLKKGISIPGGDPENPLGRYWIGFWSDGQNWIGFHGTDNPKSVGTAASHGCIRMYNRDIEELFKKVSLGTEVKVVR